MKIAEFDRCLAELEKLPPDRAEAAVDAFWNVILAPVPRDLAKAIVLLMQRPNLRIGDLMRAGIGNGAAMKARVALATVRDRLPPEPVAPEPIESVAEPAPVAAAETAAEPAPMPAEPEVLPPVKSSLEPSQPISSLEIQAMAAAPDHASDHAPGDGSADTVPDSAPFPAAVELVPQPPSPQVLGPSEPHHGAAPAAPEAAESVPEPAPSGPEKPPVSKAAKRSDPLPTGNGFKQRATRLLRTELKDGPRPQAELFSLAEADDLSPEQLIAVAERLNIRTHKGWWRLPAR